MNRPDRPGVVLGALVLVVLTATPASGGALDSCEACWNEIRVVGHALLGRACLAIGDTRRARIAFERALRIDDSHASSLMGLAACHLDAGELDLAIGALWRCRRLAPDDAGVVTRLADALEGAGRRTEALDLLAGFRLEEPEHGPVRHRLAILLFKTGEFRRAADEFRAAVRLDPGGAPWAIDRMLEDVEEDPELYRMWLSTILIGAGMYREATNTLRPLLDMDLPPRTKERIRWQIRFLEELHARDLIGPGANDEDEAPIGPGASDEDAERVRELLGRLDDEDVEVRREVIEQLDRLTFSSGLPRRVLRCLQDEDARIRMAVIRMIVRNEDARAVPVLCLLLRHRTEKDESEIVRGAIVDALLALESPAAYPVLLSALQDESIHVRERTLRALRRLTGEWLLSGGLRPLVVDRLKELQQAWWRWWESRKARDHKLATIRAIGEIGSKSMLRYVVPLLRDEDSEVFDAAYAVFSDVSGVSFGEAKDADARKRVAEKASEWLRR
jgi:tetratricopeptide (TPR) repeat protein